METGLIWQIIIAAVLGLVLVDLLVRFGFALIILPIFERTPPFGVSETKPHPDGQPIELPGSGGIALRGCLFQHRNPPPKGLILFCPELGGNCWSVMSYCAGLWEAGFDLIAIDFRNQGQSDHVPGYTPSHWLTDYEVEDVMSAVQYIKSREDLRRLPLAMMGISRGGSAVLAASARLPEVNCVACEGSFATNDLFLHFTLRWATLYIPEWFQKTVPIWHIRRTLSLARKLSELRRRCRYTQLERLVPRLRKKRVLMIAGERDSYVHPDVPRAMCRRLSNNVDDCLWVVPKAKHNGARAVRQQEYDRRLVEFFSASLPAEKRDPLSQPQPQAGGSR